MKNTFNSLSASASTMNAQSSLRRNPDGVLRVTTPVAAACAVICLTLSSAAWAQSTYQPLQPAPISSQQTTPPSVLRGPISGVDYSANAQVARVEVEVEKNDLPADGQSTNQITVRLFDKNGAVLQGEALITIEHSAGRVLIPGAKTDELGPGRLDVDKVTPGVQLKVTNGVGKFNLLAPVEPTDVKIRITAGAAVVNGTVSYLPELRDMIAAGLIEGIVNFKKTSNSVIVPTRIDDGFERELRRWTKEFNDGKGNYGLRTAFFLKGKVKGDMLLTAAFDSDKETNARLLRDIDPNRFYPVYGDSSINGFDAKSRERLYIRLDSGKSYALYGDFSTGDGFSQLTGGGAVAGVKSRNLGAYNRSATGLRGHFEKPNYFVNGFLVDDNQKQLIEEYRGNGTSGPYSVANNSAIENSEKVELITRDKNALSVVKTVQILQRSVDYAFEPFSGRILFKSPIPSIDVNGDPVSIRITYEVEQGGKKFLTYGLDGQVKIGESFEVGGSYVEDKNPTSPYRLSSINAGVRLGKSGSIVLEVANSSSTAYSIGTGSTATSTLTPSGAAGEARNDRKGSAVRLEGNYNEGSLDARGWFMRAERDFYNPAASISEGKQELGLSAKLKLTEALAVYGTAQRNEDTIPANKPGRDAYALGLNWKATDRLTLDGSLRRTQEDAGYAGTSAITSNSGAGGGFYGLGTDVVNPTTGTSVLGSGLNPVVAGGGLNPKDVSASTIRLAADYRATDRWSVNGEVEAGSSDQWRYGLGTAYQLSERSKLYGRFERRTGLTSDASLNSADRSNSFVAGIDNTFASGPTVYSEFRMRDSISSDTAQNRDMQLASGVRNSWNYAEGIVYTGGAEFLKVYNGTAREAFAINGGLDYSVSQLWKFSGRLEFRRVFDDKATAVNDTQDQYLSTLSVARKIDRDWTMLARNYLLYQNNKDGGTKLEDRFQIGAAWRPVDHNRWNALARYEYKTVADKTTSAGVSTNGDNYRSHIISLHGDYHPSRPWWFNGRFALKNTVDKTLPAASQGYTAWLVGGRVTYDITENWDIGLMTSYMYSPQGSAKQWAQGAEVGYLVRQNLWLSAGVNWMGFSDKDLTGSDYTNRGVYLRLRFKFDGTLFQGKDTNVNRALDR
jgi:hypothetical protein